VVVVGFTVYIWPAAFKFRLSLPHSTFLVLSHTFFHIFFPHHFLSPVGIIWPTQKSLHFPQTDLFFLSSLLLFLFSSSNFPLFHYPRRFFKLWPTQVHFIFYFSLSSLFTHFLFFLYYFFTFFLHIFFFFRTCLCSIKVSHWCFSFFFIFISVLYPCNSGDFKFIFVFGLLMVNSSFFFIHFFGCFFVA